ncbi:MAG: alginate lyase family protein [Ignavibacteriae bacterium]|nr:alginate lyase family protein [Ignavibacteriota bacterium]
MKRAEILGIYFWSVWYLRPGMIIRRVIRAIKGRITLLVARSRFADRVFRVTRESVPVYRAPLLPTRITHEAINLHARTFTFLNDRATLSADRDERRRAVQAKPLLWQFHYGYHDYLPGLLAEGAVTSEEVIRYLEEWSGDYPAAHPGARAAAWHPYVLSLRIESWIRLHRLLADSGGTTSRHVGGMDLLARGVEDMTRALLHNLEFATMANHLLKNIKALVLAGCFLDTRTGVRAGTRGRRLLLRELREQVLDDGMHFERSPMYHLAMTADVLDLAAALRDDDTGTLEAVESAALRMCACTRRTLHPDGRVPLFNDSVEHGALDAADVLRAGEALLGTTGETALTDPSEQDGDLDPVRVSGLLTHRRDSLFVIFDGGLVGPDYQPGHAHCDTLSYEVSWHGGRFITDTGVFHYKESPERRYARSTAAHNTVRLDTREQSDVWKSFRVGRRARVTGLHRRVEQGCSIFQAAHDGYGRVARGLIHERSFVIREAEWICVIDYIHGDGSRLIENVVHFHPDVQLQRDATGMRASAHGHACSLRALSELHVRVHETEYYPAFGVRRPRKTLVFHGTQALPLVTGYVIHFDGTAPQITLDQTGLYATIDHEGGTLSIGSRL